MAAFWQAQAAAAASRCVQVFSHQSPNRNLCRSSSSSSIFFLKNTDSGKRSVTLSLLLPFSSSYWGYGVGRTRAVVSEESNLRLESFGGDGTGEGGEGGLGNGGRGGGDDDDDDKNRRGDGEEESSNESNNSGNDKLVGMSMSQKLTLAYAALVGVGGVLGYVKSGSQKSLAFGGLSALILFYVFKELGSRPAFASSLGLGLSAALLVVMGSRFKKSRKLFPPGLVSFVSLIMAGGYLHGVLRSLGA